MKKTLTAVFMFAGILSAAPGNSVLIPQGPWPICAVVSSFPGCYAGMPHPYMLQVEPVPGAVGFDWKISYQRADGTTQIVSGYQSAAQGWTAYSIPSVGTATLLSVTPHLAGSTIQTEVR